MAAFSEFVRTVGPLAPPLPWMHGTDYFQFRKILKNGERLEPSFCSELKEDLLYLFYGRPGYRSMKVDEPRSDYLYLPVCFILKSSLTVDPLRIYPFDTGAFTLYGDHLHHKMALTDFLLDPSLDMPPRVVNAFFGENRRYLLGRVNKEALDSLAMDPEVSAYFDLISARGQSEADDRRYTVELQTKASVELSTSVEALVLCNEAMDNPDIYDVVVKKWKATPLTYMTVSGLRPREYHKDIVNNVYSYLDKEGLL